MKKRYNNKLSGIYIIVGLFMIILFTGTDINVSLLKTAWIGIVGMILFSIGVYRLEHTPSRSKSYDEDDEFDTYIHKSKW